MRSKPIAAATRVRTANADLVLEFLDVVVNFVLMRRKVYPEIVFNKRLAYGQIPVYQVVDGQVQDYIRQGLEGLGDLVSSGQDVAMFQIVLVDGRDRPLESYRLAFKGLSEFFRE